LQDVLVHQIVEIEYQQVEHYNYFQEYLKIKMYKD